MGPGTSALLDVENGCHLFYKVCVLGHSSGDLPYSAAYNGEFNLEGRSCHAEGKLKFNLPSTLLASRPGNGNTVHLCLHCTVLLQMKYGCSLKNGLENALWTSMRVCRPPRTFKGSTRANTGPDLGLIKKELGSL